MMKVLALCGSLRERSFNMAILREAQKRLKTATLVIFDRLGEIPPFNPDDSSHHASVEALRDSIKDAAAIIIASPEYVHGLPGILKNALDWIVGSGEWDNKPTALIHVTPSAMNPRYAEAALHEVIRVMSGGRIMEAAGFIVSGAFTKFDGTGKIIDPLLSETLDRSLAFIGKELKA